MNQIMKSWLIEQYIITTVTVSTLEMFIRQIIYMKKLQDRKSSQVTNIDPSSKNTVFYVPKIMVTNAMLLLPKIVEVQECVIRNQISLAFITEIWLKSTIPDSAVDFSGYTILREDRVSDNHCGVCLYIKNVFFKYIQLNDLSCCNDHEILCVQLRPNRLPRGFASLIVAVVGFASLIEVGHCPTSMELC